MIHETPGGAAPQSTEPPQDSAAGAAGPTPEPAAPAAPPRRGQLRELLDMIKFEHTVFALPFAFLGALATVRGVPPLAKVGWILAAMVGARSAAMTFNRLVDQDLDGANPRTRDRALPAGRVSRAGAVAFLGLAIVLFAYAAGRLGPLCWRLAPLALAIILGYSFCKRFTALSHVVLGLSLAGAPLGAWIAVNGRVDPPAWFLALGVLAWTAGFDILYALQDLEFDQARGLHSIPARLGLPAALWLSRGLHLAALAAWAGFNLGMEAHVFPWLGWGGGGGHPGPGAVGGPGRPAGTHRPRFLHPQQPGRPDLFRRLRGGMAGRAAGAHEK